MEINKTSCVKLRFASSTGLQSRSLIRMPLIRRDGNFHPWQKYLLSAKGFVTFIKSDFMECEFQPVLSFGTDLRSSIRKKLGVWKTNNSLTSFKLSTRICWRVRFLAFKKFKFAPNEINLLVKFGTGALSTHENE